MRKMRPLTILSALSLLVCVTTAVMWVRAVCVARADHVSIRVPGGRVVARFDPGVVKLVGPPPPGPAETEAAVRRLTRVMRNGDIVFYATSRPASDSALYMAGYAVTTREGRPFDARDFTANTPNAMVSLSALLNEGQPPVRADAYRRPLMEALDDPGRFAAAHRFMYTHGWWFAPRRPGPIKMYGPIWQEGQVFVHDMDGLRVELPPPDEKTERVRANGIPGWVYRYYLDRPTMARVDTAQLPAIRNRWQMVLGQQLVSIPYWVIVVATAVLPAAWIPRRVRQAIRLRRGLCPVCGYDLRATPERCPECGAIGPKARHARIITSCAQ